MFILLGALKERSMLTMLQAKALRICEVLDMVHCYQSHFSVLNIMRSQYTGRGKYI